MKKFLLIIAFALLLPQYAHAHQPRIVTGSDATVVQNPEISQAFYGTLDGAPHKYTIDSATPFNLYVSLLTPVAPGSADNISAVVSDSSGAIVTELNGADFTWTNFYEPFAGDDYNQGPEFEKQVEAGGYSVQIYNATNTGKYVIAIGKIESFPLAETLHTIQVLPALKSDFFGKSALSAYFNYTGLFMLGFILVTLVAVTILVWVIKRVIKKFRRKV